MVFIRSLVSAIVALGALCAAKSSTGNKVLVVIEPALNKQDYFTFFSGLEGEYTAISVVCRD
jgi:oligosaccharyltransferase complex subunit beta